MRDSQTNAPSSSIVVVRRNLNKIQREAATSIKSSYNEEGISCLHSRVARHIDLEDPRKETRDPGW